jgi:SNF2 family DNA or RNA helicase
MELIDNINRLLGDSFKDVLRSKSKVKIAASTFSIYAFEALRKELEKVDSFEFIFTSPTFVPSEVTDKLRKERREFHIPKLERERSIYGTDFEIRLKNELTQKAIAQECASWIRRKAKFKSNKSDAPMQSFACIKDNDKETIYQSLHGFTAVDLGYERGNAVSNLVSKIDEAPHTATYLNLFDQIWNDTEKLDDVTERLCEHIASVYQENSPERIYFLILYNIFHEFLDDINEDVLPNDKTGYQDSLIWQKLFNFQRDAATGIINKLETYNGCILADSVGLGKTFSALAVIKYYELRNKSVLVLCPKKLADNWLNYNSNVKTNLFVKDRFNYDVLCHTDLQRTSGYSHGIPLNRINWGNYDLVVIDESHNFRNNDINPEHETRYQKLMEQVIRSGVKTKVLMLSATPVNNRFLDLRNQLALAYEGDPENLSSKLRTEKDIDEIFRRAQATFNAWSNLPANERTAEAILSALDFDFFELLDSVTIARSRRHIETFYDTSSIGTFPERLIPKSFHCALTDRPDVIGFNDIFNQLSLMKLAVYTPAAYILPSRLAHYEHLSDQKLTGGQANINLSGREQGVKALMTVNLLKRLESSVHSFRLTLSKLRGNHLSTIDKIENFQRTGSEAVIADLTKAIESGEPDSDDLPDPDDEQISEKNPIKLSDMDLKSWKRDLEMDLIIIDELLEEMDKVSPEDDSKLQHLKAQIQSKLESPINAGNKKILIFTAFADTADYLYENLASDHLEANQLHTAKVTGQSNKSTLGRGYDFQSLLTLFSPRSKEKQAILPDENGEIDLLIGTDCISEGQNLQDCDYVINFDIHWNPVRIIQRFGRIDRIGSINARIQLVNYWPDITLDEYINLKERVENRMIIADVTATADDNPLDSKANDISYRREQLRRLQEEVIEMEDLKTGVSITDLGLNDFRMDLLGYIKTGEDLSRLPNGMHTVIPAAPERGLEAGVIFTLRNRNQGINVNQQNRLHPYYIVYINHAGKVLVNHTEPKRMLDLIRSACKGRDKPLPAAYAPFNRATADGRDMDAHSKLLQQAIQSMIEVKEDQDIDSLFTGTRTTALLNTISGLEDFELIAFVVVQNPN